MTYEDKEKALERLILKALIEYMEGDDSPIPDDVCAAAEDMTDDPDEIQELAANAIHSVKQKLKVLLKSQPRPSKKK